MVFLLKGGLYQRMLLRCCWVGACGLRWRFLRGLCFFRRWWCCRSRRRSRVLCLGGLGWWMDRTLRCRNRWTWSVVCFQWIWNSWLRLWYFFPLVKVAFFRDVLLMRSRIFLPILPISDFVELMSLQVGLFAKFGLWSLSVMCLLCRRFPVSSLCLCFLYGLFGSSQIVLSYTISWCFSSSRSLYVDGSSL